MSTDDALIAGAGRQQLIDKSPLHILFLTTLEEPLEADYSGKAH